MRKSTVLFCLLLSLTFITSCVNPNGSCNCEDCQCNKNENIVPDGEPPKEENNPIIEIVPSGEYECYHQKHYIGAVLQESTDKEYLAKNNMTITDNNLVGSLRDMGIDELKLHFEKDGKFTERENFTWIYNYGKLEIHIMLNPMNPYPRKEEIFYYKLIKK